MAKEVVEEKASKGRHEAHFVLPFVVDISGELGHLMECRWLPHHRRRHWQLLHSLLRLLRLMEQEPHCPAPRKPPSSSSILLLCCPLLKLTIEYDDGLLTYVRG